MDNSQKDLLYIKRSPMEDIFLPYTFGMANPKPEFFQSQVDEQIAQLQILREEDSREYSSIVNSLKLLLLFRTIQEKVDYLLSIPSLSIGFDVLPEGVEFNDNEPPGIRNVKIAERIVVAILSGIGEEILEAQ